VIVVTQGAPYREGSQFGSVGNILYMLGSSGTVNGYTLWPYTNEMQLFGSRVESQNYDVCSIRDHEEDGLLPDCDWGGVSDGEVTYFEFDRKAHAVVAQYLARAQTQPSPFNVQLPAP
jgi:hypothetical protein